MLSAVPPLPHQSMTARSELREAGYLSGSLSARPIIDMLHAWWCRMACSDGQHVRDTDEDARQPVPIASVDAQICLDLGLEVPILCMQHILVKMCAMPPSSYRFTRRTAAATAAWSTTRTECLHAAVCMAGQHIDQSMPSGPDAIAPQYHMSSPHLPCGSGGVSPRCMPSSKLRCCRVPHRCGG